MHYTKSFSCITNVHVYFYTDAVAFSRAHFGAGTGPIYLNNVGCTGGENKLINCPWDFSVRCYGGHSWDAGVRCQGTHYYSFEM